MHKHSDDPSSDPVSGYYTGGGYLQTHPGWHAEDARWKAENILKMLRKHDLQPASVAEIGCGSGEMLLVLRESISGNTQFTGYEISPQALELARTRIRERLEFRTGGVPEMLLDKPYDLSLVIDVFEHVEDFYGFLKQMRRTARAFVFHIPLDLSVQTVLRAQPLLRKRRKAGHIHYFTRETALAALTDSGYAITDWCYTGSYTERPARTLRSRLLNIPRRFFFMLHRDLTVRFFGGYSLLVLATAGQAR